MGKESRGKTGTEKKAEEKTEKKAGEKAEEKTEGRKEVHERKIQWHPAFCSAVQLMFKNEKVHLEYEREHTLNTKPLMLDLLVVKKPSESMLEEPLGHLFKGYNIMEYKSPGDAVNVDTYYKVYGYACLYKAAGEWVDEIKEEDITISIVRDGKPCGLLAFFRKKGYSIKKPFPGIYHVKKDGMFDTQIVVSGELQEEEQIWLRALAPDLEVRELDAFLRKTVGELSQGQKELMDSVLEVVLAVNKKKVSALKGDEREMCEALRELMADEIKEAISMAAKEAAEKAAEKAAAEGKAEGKAEGQISTRIQMALKMLRAKKPAEEILEFTEIGVNELEALNMFLEGRSEEDILKSTGISSDKFDLMRKQIQGDN